MDFVLLRLKTGPYNTIERTSGRILMDFVLLRPETGPYNTIERTSGRILMDFVPQRLETNFHSTIDLGQPGDRDQDDVNCLRRCLKKPAQIPLLNRSTWMRARRTTYIPWESCFGSVKKSTRRYHLICRVDHVLCPGSCLFVRAPGLF